jgi:hypothetical protein
MKRKAQPKDRQWLKDLLADRGLDQNHLAKEWRVDPGFVARFLDNGEGSFTPIRVAGISRLCRISTAKIVANLSEPKMPLSKLSKVDMRLVLAISSVLNVQTETAIDQLNHYDRW